MSAGITFHRSLELRDRALTTALNKLTTRKRRGNQAGFIDLWPQRLSNVRYCQINRAAVKTYARRIPVGKFSY